MNISEKRKPFWLFYYTLPALFGLFAIYLFISLFDKNLFCGGDGWFMQYTATEYSREFWRNVLHGKWTMMEFTLGQGMDPWICMSYYGLTDPMNLIFAFVSQAAVPTVYTVITMLKMFLGGAAFGLYASTKSTDHKAVAMGSLVYVFSGFFILWLFCPGLLSAGYLFPLLLYAIDRAFEKKRYTLFSVLTLFAYTTNYYAGFTCSMMLMVYAILRILLEGQWNKTAFLGYLKTICAHALGIMCSLFILLPIAGAMLGGTRGASAGYSNSILWFNLHYYFDLLIGFVTPFVNGENYWAAPYRATPNFLCIAAPAIIMFVTHKTTKGSKERLLKWSLFACMVFLCVPFFSKLFNMWMYPTHRWAFACAMVIGLIVVWAIPKFNTMNWKHKLLSALVLIGSGAASFLNMYPRAAWVTLITSIVCSVILLIRPRRLTAYIACCLYLFMSVATTFIFNTYGAQFCPDNLTQRANAEIYAAVELSDEELEQFIRVAITDDSTACNSGLLLGYNTTTALWNVMPHGITHANSEQHFPNAQADWWIDGSDDRTALQTLAGAKYFITTETGQDFVPYGFKFTKTVDLTLEMPNQTNIKRTFCVYTNQYNPGIGYMYTSTLSCDTYQALDIASKQLALMKYAVLADSTVTDAEITAFEVPAHTITQNGKITLNVTIPEGYELYLHVDKAQQIVQGNTIQIWGAQYWKTKQNDANRPITSVESLTSGDPTAVIVTAEDGDGTQVLKTLRCHKPSFHLSSGNATRTLCLGHQLTGATQITLEYPADQLALEGIKVYACQTNEYVTAAQELCNNAWTNMQYSDNWIAGTMNAQQDGIFQLAIPYSTGWKAYVDGQEVPVFTSGIQYMGIQLSKGEHNIRFEYKTPGLVQGTVLSCMSMMMLFVWFAQEHGLFERMYTQSRNHKCISKKKQPE